MQEHDDLTREPGGRIRLGVSACLIGERVRYDGRDKLDGFVAGALAEHFELVPVCPEVAIGLGVPREPIRLVRSPSAPRAVGVRTPDLDVTGPLGDCAARMSDELAGISGYVFKSRSPSCAIEGVEIVEGDGSPGGSGAGIYAAEMMQRNPLLPVTDEIHLGGAAGREHFLERVHAYHRWQRLLANGVTAEGLVEFHTRHKLVLMAHGARRAKAVGRLVAEAGRGPAHRTAAAYGRAFMDALSHPATRGSHTDVLLHVMGYLKRSLDSAQKAELLRLIHDYRLGAAPRSAPLERLRAHFRRHPDPYIERQLYFDTPELLGHE